LQEVSANITLKKTPKIDWSVIDRKIELCNKLKGIEASELKLCSLREGLQDTITVNLENIKKLKKEYKEILESCKICPTCGREM
jgi:hypothetical protein